jgi:hypothetical protein
MPRMPQRPCGRFQAGRVTGKTQDMRARMAWLRAAPWGKCCDGVGWGEGRAPNPRALSTQQCFCLTACCVY